MKNSTTFDNEMDLEEVTFKLPKDLIRELIQIADIKNLNLQAIIYFALDEYAEDQMSKIN